jgi:hypothetical protein
VALEAEEFLTKEMDRVTREVIHLLKVIPEALTKAAHVEAEAAEVLANLVLKVAVQLDLQEEMEQRLL